MARPSPELIAALLATADRLENGATYRWTHLGRCNCGHLAVTMTSVDPDDLHRWALARAGDWRNQRPSDCSSNDPLDRVLRALFAAGLDASDLEALENLSDPQVLARLPRGLRLHCGQREHVIWYLRAWAQELRLTQAHQPTGVAA